MSKVKYYYDTKTLSYRKIERSTKQKLSSSLLFMLASVFLGGIFFTLFLLFVDSPKEKRLKRELQAMEFQYKILNERMDKNDLVLQDLQNRDDNIYRVIFESDPIPSTIRQAGFGGVNRYKKLEGYLNSQLMIDTERKLDSITKKMYVQSVSFDDVKEMALNKEKMLSSIPAVQPISNEDLRRVASGFGYRIHPIYKVKKLHTGLDFSAKTGTPIYATGDGKVKVVKNTGRRGYGKHVIIDHGYNYKTLYGHMSQFNVRRGQSVKRGDIIGYVGNTGTSSAPHLHYEVWKDDRKINPINFFYNDLTPEEYDKMIELSSSINQSFD